MKIRSMANLPVTSTATSQFPMALFKANAAQTLTFSLSSAINVASYFRTATTLSFAGGRPLVMVNSYSCGTPAAPTTIDSRGVTRGAYRGWGDVYTCTIPAGTLKAGTNTITISIASGSSGDAFLSPSVVSLSIAFSEIIGENVTEPRLIMNRSSMLLSYTTKLGPVT